MSGSGSANRWGIILLCAAGLAIATWIAIAPTGGQPGSEATAATKPASPRQSTATGSFEKPREMSRVAARRPEANHRIPQSGRLSIEASSLPEAGVLALELGLDKEDGGVEPLAVRVASVDGRAFDTTAVRQDANAADVHIDIDADWLQPGKYLIQIKTEGKGPLPLRRYVLEVR